MKAIQRIKRATAWGLSALALSSTLMGTVACTRGNHNTPGDTTATTTAVTTPAVTTPATGHNSTGATTTRPLDPDAGTVDPNGNAGDPPTGTEGNTNRSYRSRMMH
jgi:hypothetical protein